MERFFTTKRLCRAGVIAALYTVLTYAFASFAFGPFQIRPAEALCLLPLLFPEAVPALCVGCILSNLASPYAFYDVIFGTLATLLATFGTYMVGRFIKNDCLRAALGGVFPVLCNALIVPVIIVFLCGGAEGYTSAWTAYFAYAGSIALSEAVFVYAFGVPLYYALRRRRK